MTTIDTNRPTEKSQRGARGGVKKRADAGVHRRESSLQEFARIVQRSVCGASPQDLEE